MNTLSTKRRRDPSAQRKPDQELSAGQGTGHYAYMDLVDLDALHAHHRWFIKELSVEFVVVKDFASYLAQDLADVADVDAGRERHIDHGPSPVARQVGELRDRAVRGADDLAVGGADLGHSQRHVLDGADDATRDANAGDADEVAETVLPFGDDEESCEQVLDQALSPKPERNTDD